MSETKRAESIKAHLGSERSAECLTRPQYVLRSYCDAGRSRFPGKEADIVATKFVKLSRRQLPLKKDRLRLDLYGMSHKNRNNDSS